MGFARRAQQHSSDQAVRAGPACHRPIPTLEYGNAADNVGPPQLAASLIPDGQRNGPSPGEELRPLGGMLSFLVVPNWQELARPDNSRQPKNRSTVDG